MSTAGDSNSQVKETRATYRFQLRNLPMCIKQSRPFSDIQLNRVTLTVGLDALGIPTVSISSDHTGHTPTRDLTEQRYAVLQILAQLAFDIEVEPLGPDEFMDHAPNSLGWYRP